MSDKQQAITDSNHNDKGDKTSWNTSCEKMLYAEISTACLRVFEHDGRCVDSNTEARLAISNIIVIGSRRDIIYKKKEVGF